MTEPERACPTCGSREPIVDYLQSATASIPTPRREIAEDWRCRDPFHQPTSAPEERCGGSPGKPKDHWRVPGNPSKGQDPCPGCEDCKPASPTRPEDEGRAELWRCPECGAAAWHHTSTYPLPGGPALCTHPTPTYERFVLADLLSQSKKELKERTAERDKARADRDNAEKEEREQRALIDQWKGMYYETNDSRLVAQAALAQARTELEATNKYAEEGWSWLDDALGALGVKDVFGIKGVRSREAELVEALREETDAVTGVLGLLNYYIGPGRRSAVSPEKVAEYRALVAARDQACEILDRLSDS